MRKYSTSPTMFMDRWTQKVVQPDANLIKALHSYLDLIPNDDHALAIDLIVADLLRFHNPQQQPMGIITIQEGNRNV